MSDEFHSDDYTYGNSIGSNASIDQQGVTSASSGDSENTEKDALLYCHPDYEANIEKWKKYSDCYESEDIYKYIHQHLREHDDLYNLRVKRGYYLNYCASIVDLIVSYLFHTPIERQPNSEIFKELYADADMCGTTYALFMEQAAAYAQVYGHVGILVDLPQVDGELESEEDRKNQNVRPYLVPILATQIKDWSIDNYKKFRWVKIEIDVDAERSWKESKDTETRYFVIWTRTNWTKYSISDDKVTILAEGSHNLGEVPLVILVNEDVPSHPWMGQSTIRDIADINLAILNWCSLADEEIFERCLNVLAIEGDDETPIQLSHHNVLRYPAGATHAPQYLNPGTSPLELIGKQIDRGKDEIYRLAKLGGSTGMQDVKEATSGIAYAYEFNETNQSLARKAAFLEQAEIDIHRLYAKWLGKKFTGVITYPREFGVEDFLMDLTLLLKLREVSTSETAVKELEKKIMAKMFANGFANTREKILAEILQSDGVPFALAVSNSFVESFETVPTEATGKSASGKRDPSDLPTTDKSG